MENTDVIQNNEITEEMIDFNGMSTHLGLFMPRDDPFWRESYPSAGDTISKF